jgi:hypothetical protein
MARLLGNEGGSSNVPRTVRPRQQAVRADFVARREKPGRTVCQILHSTIIGATQQKYCSAQNIKARPFRRPNRLILNGKIQQAS